MNTDMLLATRSTHRQAPTRSRRIEAACNHGVVPDKHATIVDFHQVPDWRDLHRKEPLSIKGATAIRVETECFSEIIGILPCNAL